MGTGRHCQLAELGALLLFCGQYAQCASDCDGYVLGLSTENPMAVKKCFTLLKKAFSIGSDCVADQAKLAQILTKVGGMGAPLNEKLLTRTCCMRTFLRGAFLAVGSLSDPKKGYHLEFVCSDEEKALLVQSLLGAFAIESKITRRKKYFITYVKEGAGIVDFLNVIETPVALMDLENLRILKEMRGSINRQVNCETANISKTVTAAARQVEDIVFLRDFYGLQKLPKNLREIAQVRLDFPDAALKDLGEHLDPPVGKSGVNHRLRKLSELADTLRE